MAPVPSTSGEPMPSTSREPMPSTSAAITELGVPLPSSSKDDVFPSTESGGSAVAEAENYFLRQQIEELNKKCHICLFGFVTKMYKAVIN
jgi:hypothetical protein